ncbi:glycosyltransferase family 2 protein [Candidatus Microgenomates bacterium]|nr:MAG: glycosyltransferase family 2 protein [Candidatus Microgenomates bacterium]
MFSAVILTKNEENNIKDCIASLSWCNEIIVIDDDSFDKTAEVARKLGAKVYLRSLNKDFSAQRNFGLLKAANEWVIFVDADERVTETLSSEILAFQFSNFNKFSGFFINRKDNIWEKELKHGESGNIKLLRLAKKDAGKWEGAVHERWKISGQTDILSNELIHFPHQTISEFLKEINFYTDIRANELFRKGKKVNIFSIICYPVVKFLQNYFIKFGFLDGLEGFIFAVTMSFHSFLVRGKLWQMLQNEK